MLKSPEQIIADILVKEMKLSDQHVWVRYQDKKIPPDAGIYIVVGFQDDGGGVVGVNNETFATDEGMSQTQTAIVREMLQIDIRSKDNSARQRRFEVLLALASVYSVQQQEKYQFKIFKKPLSINNTSSAEASSNMNRFTILMACQTWTKKTTVLDENNGDYFDKFSTRADDSRTITNEEGLIEFNIPMEE